MMLSISRNQLCFSSNTQLQRKSVFCTVNADDEDVREITLAVLHHSGGCNALCCFTVVEVNVNNAGGYVQLGRDPTFLLMQMLAVIVSKVGLAEHRCSVKHFQILCCAFAPRTRDARQQNAVPDVTLSWRSSSMSHEAFDLQKHNRQNELYYVKCELLHVKYFTRDAPLLLTHYNGFM